MAIVYTTLESLPTGNYRKGHLLVEVKSEEEIYIDGELLSEEELWDIISLEEEHPSEYVPVSDRASKWYKELSVVCPWATDVQKPLVKAVFWAWLDEVSEEEIAKLDDDSYAETLMKIYESVIYDRMENKD